MPSEPEVALVLTAEQWVENFHRHCTDHGGARVRQVLVDPALVLDELYDVLVVSHRWPGLTHALVDAVHTHGRTVLGVFDPDEPASRAYLSRLAVDGVLAADAPMPSFVEAIAANVPSDGERVRRSSAERTEPAPARGGATVIVVGGPAGSGKTELAIALGASLAERGEPTVVIDADETTPALAPRLGLPIEPSLRTAVDAVEHDLGNLDELPVAVPGVRFRALGGLANVAAWPQIGPQQLQAVLDRLAQRHRFVVVDTGPCLEDLTANARERYGQSRAAVRSADVLVAAAIGSPVGVTRLLDWVAGVHGLGVARPIHVVVNRAPSDAFRRRELTEELCRGFEPASVSFVPGDRRVEAAGWDGTTTTHGPFRNAVDALAARVVPVARASRRRRARRHSSPSRVTWSA